MSEPIQAFPLSWPLGQRRTESHRRCSKLASRRLTVASALHGIQEQVRLLGRARDLVVSSNIALRADGFPRSGMRLPDDPGVAVYFRRKGEQLVFACDKHPRPEQNMRAIAQHLEALRGMERWGVGTLEQAFAGYRALPAEAEAPPWWRVLGLSDRPMTAEALRRAYLEAAKRAHPDVGGTHATMSAITQAFEVGRAAIGGTI